MVYTYLEMVYTYLEMVLDPTLVAGLLTASVCPIANLSVVLLFSHTYFISCVGVSPLKAAFQRSLSTPPTLSASEAAVSVVVSVADVDATQESILNARC